jgi:hypothetical protein
VASSFSSISVVSSSSGSPCTSSAAPKAEVASPGDVSLLSVVGAIENDYHHHYYYDNWANGGGVGEKRLYPCYR